MDKENPVDIDRLLNCYLYKRRQHLKMKERIGAANIRRIQIKNPDSKILQRQLTLLNRANYNTFILSKSNKE